MSELKSYDIGATVAYNKSAIILDGETLSNFCDVGGFKLTGLIVPAGLTGTVLTFKMSPDDENQEANKGTIKEIDGSAFEVTVPAAPDAGDEFTYIELPIVKFAGVKYVALESNATQTGDIEITLALSLV